MVNVSDFSKKGISELFFLSEALLKNNFQILEIYSTKNEKIFDQVCKKFFGEFPNDLDMEFMAKFIQLNNDKIFKYIQSKSKTEKNSLLKDFVIPEPKNFKVQYEVAENLTKYSTYEDSWSSYDRDWVTEAMSFSYNRGNWYPDEGTTVSVEEDNYEINDIKYQVVDEIKETKKPFFQKLISENCEELISELDEDGLRKMKKIIENKLRSS